MIEERTLGGMYADVLADVACVMAEVTRTFPAIGAAAARTAPSDDTLESLAERSRELGDTGLGLQLHQWVVAHDAFRRALADLDEFRDNHHVATAEEQRHYSELLHSRIERVRAARHELEREADHIRAHVVAVLDAGLVARARDSRQLG